MPQLKDLHLTVDLSHPQYYFSRELSWLEFNRRVLRQAMDVSTPLLERLRFIAVFSNNLDEYFMIRASALKGQIAAQIERRSPDGRTPKQQLEAFSNCLQPFVKEQHQYFEQTLRPALAAHGIHLLNYPQLSEAQRQHLRDYFQRQIFPILTPLASDRHAPYLANLSLCLATVLYDPKTQEERFARVELPQTLPRFISILESGHGTANTNSTKPVVWAAVPLEQVIEHNLDLLFPGMQVRHCYPFRITRNADLDVGADEAEDLLLAIEQEVRRRQFDGLVVRLEVDDAMPPGMQQRLLEELNLDDSDSYAVQGLLCLSDLIQLTELSLPELKERPWAPTLPHWLPSPHSHRSTENATDNEFFAAIRRQDGLLHHPYQSFTGTVQRFITEAAFDPHVLAIKMTLYRTSGKSPIVDALITAAENGKQVVVLVELKARFDEENNINWARKLEKMGVHVVYGVAGLKTHLKLALVVRQEDNRIRRYVHIGTGNYNHRTARLYTDLGLLSCRDDLGADLTDLFNFLTGYSRQQAYRKLLVAPFDLRDRLLTLIDREINHCKAGRHGRIVVKMNALVDPDLITALYKASQAGVKIDLIVRGICCLRPGIPGISDNIRVISILGRFLEHSRIFYAHNNGHEEVYIGSADWMPRNLDRRVEVMVPIDDPNLAKDVQVILGILLADNRQAWELQSDGRYIQRQPGATGAERTAQAIFMDMAQQAATRVP